MQNNHGGKRAGAGRPRISKTEKTATIAFRILEFAQPQIQNYLKSLSVTERTKLLIKICIDIPA
jgi:hypothetical protein